VLRELRDAGWIRELHPDEAPVDDARRKYYRLTPAGRRRLLDEAKRLEKWAGVARARLLPEPG
jgi:DNA-binding PadR family transcriptional regulator